MLPFAGGSGYSYNGIVKQLPDHITPKPLELPGRGRRSNEDLLTNIHDMVDDLLPEILDVADQPFAIYGHSMGTLLAYLIANQLVLDYNRPPKCIFLTGRGGPSSPKQDRNNHLLPKGEFIRKLDGLGGFPPDVLKDPYLLDYIEPIIRADFEAVEKYQHEESEPLDLPFYVITGTEENISDDEIEAWQKETTHELKKRKLAGDHFFILDHEEELARMIAMALSLSEVKHSLQSYSF